MLNELNIEEKMVFINHNIQFWSERLKESNESVEFLKNNGDRLKIDMNNQDILDIEAKIIVLQQELDNIRIWMV